jgi:hypothetical protein
LAKNREDYIMNYIAQLIGLALFGLIAPDPSLQAESEVFALQVRGSVFYREEGQPSRPLEWGQRILPNYVIELDKDGYLKAADSVRVTEFSGPRIVTFPEIQLLFESAPPEKTRNIKFLLKYIWGQVSRWWSRMAAGGEDTLVRAAVRARESRMDRQIPLAPRNGIVLGDSIALTWFNESAEVEQTLVLLDNDFDPVFRKEVQGRSVILDAAALHLQPGATYYWSVTPPEVGRHDVPFKIADRRLAQKVRNEIKQIEGVENLDLVAEQLSKAFVYEQNQCHGNAYYEYASAVGSDTSSTVVGLFTMFLVDKLGLSQIEAAAVTNEMKKR